MNVTQEYNEKTARINAMRDDAAIDAACRAWESRAAEIAATAPYAAAVAEGGMETVTALVTHYGYEPADVLAHIRKYAPALSEEAKDAADGRRGSLADLAARFPVEVLRIAGRGGDDLNDGGGAADEYRATCAAGDVLLAAVKAGQRTGEAARANGITAAPLPKVYPYKPRRWVPGKGFVRN